MTNYETPKGRTLNTKQTGCGSNDAPRKKDRAVEVKVLNSGDVC